MTSTDVHRRPPTATPFTGRIEGNFIGILENDFKFNKLIMVFNSLPVFGHYWFTGKPAVISPRFACLGRRAR
jgi:hypothetical protein